METNYQLTNKQEVEFQETIERVRSAKSSLRQIVSCQVGDSLETKSINGSGFSDYAVVDGKVFLDEQPTGIDRLASYQVRPMIEPRVYFKINKLQMEMVEAGIASADLGPLEEAVTKLAYFEEKLLLEGLDNSMAKGLLTLLANPVIKTDGTPESVISTILKAAVTLRQKNIEGPYRLLVGKDLLAKTAQLVGGTTLAGLIEEELGQELAVSDYLSGALLLPVGSTDICLHFAKDMTVILEQVDSDNFCFCLTERLNSQIVNPFSAVKIDLNEAK